MLIVLEPVTLRVGVWVAVIERDWAETAWVMTFAGVEKREVVSDEVGDTVGETVKTSFAITSNGSIVGVGVAVWAKRVREDKSMKTAK